MYPLIRLIINFLMKALKGSQMLATLSFVGAIALAKHDKIPEKASETNSAKATKVGLDFFMVGDYGYVGNMAPAYLTFNKMDDIIDDTSDPRNNIDFLMTMGDNLYPWTDSKNPSDAEFDVMMSLFTQRDNLKSKTIYAVRGNHDCYFDQ